MLAGMRVGLVQMQSTDDLAANLRAAEAGVKEATRSGAEWVALPEMFACLRREGRPFPHAEALAGPESEDGPVLAALRRFAREGRCWLLGGTLAEAAPGGRVHNTSLLLAPDGEIKAAYRKMHLFDVDLRAQGGQSYRESASIAPGAAEPALAHTPFGVVGLSVCYDLRFPELYREMSARGAQFITVPSAFAKETGRDHWEVLLRARAIENQCFVLAPAQWGRHAEDRESYGRSMVVDPWGVVLAAAPDRPCVVLADLDLEHQERVRSALPVLKHRRL